MAPAVPRYKRPESVLVVVHARTEFLLLRRTAPPCWQSVTGSMDWDETDPAQTARRELREEVGLVAVPQLRDLGWTNRYLIWPALRACYAPDVEENCERVFELELPEKITITLSSEHTEYGWFGSVAAAAKVTSWTNREAIARLSSGRRISDGGNGISV